MPRFDVDRWCADVRRAIDAADMDSLVPLLYENDPNGIFSWEDLRETYREVMRHDPLPSPRAVAEAVAVACGLGREPL